ncbi:tyrosyl-tRNA synthetase [Phyllosticta citriasiana]|uniref:tyrosyl-tRNA synthetase n=1 Tax=Phyllosticta citriasiana TaxID=595635 RepID=UPI0030FD7784
MPSTALFQHGSRPGVHVCRQCASRRPISPAFTRRITQDYLRKTLEAEMEWKEKAKEIKAGKQPSFMSFLDERGYVKQATSSKKEIETLMTEKRIGAYCGIDPTAPSMHVGHLLPFMVIFWMYLHGFKACTLLGGATAKIGDPEGRTNERNRQKSDERKANMALMHMQIKRLWQSVESIGSKYGYQREWAWRRSLANNNAWHNKTPLVEIMGKLGTHFRIGPMLSRETVKIRQQNGAGMSFAEFSYPLLQAWDFWELYCQQGIQLQIGGADQFGNILTGVQALNAIRANENDPALESKIRASNPKDDHLFVPHGLTVPLLETASGEKIGKSAGNAIWLDPTLTSSFDLYGYFVKTADSDVERYLKLFTFVPTPTIRTVIEEHEKDPSKRIAQHLLAAEFVELVHGPNAAKEASDMHRNIVSKRTSVSMSSLKTRTRAEANNPNSPSTFVSSQLNKTAPHATFETFNDVRITLPKSLVYGNSLGNVLYLSGLVSSKSEGHRLIAHSGGAYVGGPPGSRNRDRGEMGDELKFTPIKMASSTAEGFIFGGNKLLLRIGKWKMKLVTVVPDEEFQAMGISVPGGWEGPKGKEETAQEEQA